MGEHQSSWPLRVVPLFERVAAGVCQKPKVKCADCASRQFIALTPVELRRHLEGRQTIGTYPPLTDETCWLVAIDLDGASWRDDVVALRESAEDLGVLVLVERSRSGDGAHAWVLFSEPVSARVARSVGSLLLTRAMSRRAIAMSSYDRLSPNQNTIPAGGLGNLIALPLQRDRREHGCTVSCSLLREDEFLPVAKPVSFEAVLEELDRKQIRVRRRPGFAMHVANRLRIRDRGLSNLHPKQGRTKWSCAEARNT